MGCGCKDKNQEKEEDKFTTMNQQILEKKIQVNQPFTSATA